MWGGSVFDLVTSQSFKIMPLLVFGRLLWVDGKTSTIAGEMFSTNDFTERSHLYWQTQHSAFSACAPAPGGRKRGIGRVGVVETESPKTATSSHRSHTGFTTTINRVQGTSKRQSNKAECRKMTPAEKTGIRTGSWGSRTRPRPKVDGTGSTNTEPA